MLPRSEPGYDRRRGEAEAVCMCVSVAVCLRLVLASFMVNSSLRVLQGEMCWVWWGFHPNSWNVNERCDEAFCGRWTQWNKLFCIFSHRPVRLSAGFAQILDEAQFSKQYQWQSCSITEWTSQQVARWLTGLNLEHHIPEFTAQNIDGEQLLQLESSELKVSYHVYSVTCLHLLYVFMDFYLI